MAKSKTIEYKLFPNLSGDLYLACPSFRKNGSGKFSLTADLTQKELKYIYECGNDHIVYVSEAE